MSKNKINLFPFILQRIGGMPFNLLQKIDLSINHPFFQHLESQKDVERERITLLDQLTTFVSTTSDYQLKRLIANIRTEIFNNRTFRLKNIQERQDEKEHFPHELLQSLELFQQKRQKYRDQEQQQEAAFKKVIEDQLQMLFNLADTATVKEAFAFSSHSFLNQLNKYSDPGLPVNKKKVQTGLKLTEYLCRMGAKTTPFHLFAPVGLIKTNGESMITASPVRHVAPNNLIFTILTEWLLHYPPFYRKVELGLNPTLTREKDHFKVLINSRNIESFQYFEVDLLIDFIHHQLAETNITFETLVKMLLDNVQTDKASLEAYVMKLVDLGLLVWKLPVKNRGLDWSHFLINISLKDQLLLEIKSFFHALSEGRENLTRAPQNRQKRIHQYFNTLMERLAENIKVGQIEAEQASVFKQFTPDIVKIRPEEMWFADVAVKKDLTIAKHEIEAVCSSLNNLWNIWESNLSFPVKDRLFQFFQGCEKQEVPLLEFYEDLIKSNFPISELWRPELKEEAWDNLFDIRKDNAVYLSPKKPMGKNVDSMGRAALFQPFREKGQFYIVLNAFSIGHGRLMARFLPLFPKEVLEQLRDYNKEAAGDQIWAEQLDASPFNANIHPWLVPADLVSPGCLYREEPDKIGVEELMVSAIGQELALNHRENGQKVLPFNLGLETLDSRSALFQLLSVFNDYPPSTAPMRTHLQAAYEKPKSEGIFVYPRLYFEEKVVVARKAWFLENNALPQKAKGQTDFQYFQFIQKWKRAHNLPDYIFIKIEAERTKRIRDHLVRQDVYKPQMISFHSPIQIRLFSKLLKKAKEGLWIEEMLPAPDQLMRVGAAQHVLELGVEWRGEY